jgi:biopolymer transport protein ExbB
MWPLFACAIVSVTVMIERVYVLRRAGAHGDETAERVKSLLIDGRYDEALDAAQGASNPVGRVMAAGIRNRALRPALLEQTLQTAAMKELPALNRRLGILDTIVTLSPLLGLLGTITGMIRAFQVVATASGASAAPAITGGVAEALIATATGLAIAIVTLPVFNGLNERVREIIGEMELYGTQTQTILMERQFMEEVTLAPAAATA